MSLVLSIGKLTGGAGSARYYEECVASGREDYYAGEGEAPGQWLGSAAADLGLEGVVPEGALERLLVDGAHPVSGESLRSTRAQVHGFDLTFSAPKSVSVLQAMGIEEVNAAVVRAHTAAIRDALGYLEREAVQVRRGRGGRVREHAGGFVAASYRHRMSRAGDPQLHTHVVVANLALGSDGRWTALFGAPLYTHAKTAGYLYQASLRHHLSRELGVEWGPVRNGMAEIAGLPTGVLEHFSQRRAEIREAMAERGVTSARAAQTAALETRRAKDYGAPMSSIYERWKARAAEHGFDRDALSNVLGRPQRSPTSDERQAAAKLLAGEAGMTAQASTFTRRDAVRAWAEQHRQGADVARVEEVADRWLSSGLAVQLDGARVPPALSAVIATRRGRRVAEVEARYSTPEMLATEQRLLAAAAQRVGEETAVAEPGAVEAALRARPYLAEEQRALVRELTGSGDGVQVVRAKAGAGKTTALDAAREAWQRSAISVQGVALGSFATKELQDSGIEACTIASLLRDLRRPAGHVPRGSVLIVDEAGMVGTRTLARLATEARRAGAKLILVGDDRQLPEIDAGGAFRGLAERLGAIELRHNRRQRDPEDRRILDAHRDGRPEELIESLLRRGRITVAADVEQTRRALVADWWQSADADGRESAVMVALRRSEVRALNELAREQMRAAGRLADRELVVGNDLAFAVGDRIVTRQNDRALGVVNGSRADVVAIGDDGALTIRLDGGDHVTLAAEYVTGQRGYQPFVEHGYAVTAHGLQGGTVDRTFVLGSEDLYREWGYVAFSRHRIETRFYVTAPDPGEDHRSTRPDGRDPLEPIVRAMGQSRAKHLAIDTAGHLHAIPDDQLRAEAGHLRGLLDTAPSAAAHALDRIDTERARVTADLRTVRAELEAGEQTLTRRRDRQHVEQRAGAIQRAIDGSQRELATLDQQRAEIVRRAGDPDAWLAAHTTDIRRLAAVKTELHRRTELARTNALRMLAVDPPAHITDELGPRPDEPSRRRAWDRGARLIETYRHNRVDTINPGQPGLADRPPGHAAERTHETARRALDQAKADLRAPTERRTGDRGPER